MIGAVHDVASSIVMSQCKRTLPPNGTSFVKSVRWKQGEEAERDSYGEVGGDDGCRIGFHLVLPNHALCCSNHLRVGADLALAASGVHLLQVAAK